MKSTVKFITPVAYAPLPHKKGVKDRGLVVVLLKDLIRVQKMIDKLKESRLEQLQQKEYKRFLKPSMFIEKLLGKKARPTIDDFLHVIPWEDIEHRLGKREYKKFCKWMGGQTVSTHGVYPDDLDRFLQGLPVID